AITFKNSRRFMERITLVKFDRAAIAVKRVEPIFTQKFVGAWALMPFRLSPLPKISCPQLSCALPIATTRKNSLFNPQASPFQPQVKPA
ncbi:MAG: hypothetical protein RMK18_12825, partial [Armatimonadota bacterium]|nr:hypothetical protein [Armatimonadota bacterium]